MGGVMMRGVVVRGVVVRGVRCRCHSPPLYPYHHMFALPLPLLVPRHHLKGRGEEGSIDA